MEKYEVIIETDVACPSVISIGEVGLMVVRYSDDNKYGIEVCDYMSACTYEELMDDLTEYGFLSTFPKLKKISVARFDTEAEAVELANELIEILVSC
jgi:hypothetical protein